MRPRKHNHNFQVCTQLIAICFRRRSISFSLFGVTLVMLQFDGCCWSASFVLSFAWPRAFETRAPFSGLISCF
ncbi:hypothetical protein BDW67DRAFT_165700 [Aspergillus spinulosporus]